MIKNNLKDILIIGKFISYEDLLENNKLNRKIVLICSVSNHERSRNDYAMRNCILARAAKDNGAEQVVLVEPDLFYSAQDRGPHRIGELEKDRPDVDLKKFDGQAFTSLLYAELLKKSGVDAVVTVHNHSIKVQNLFAEIFEGNFHNLIPTEVYAHYIKTSNFSASPVYSYSNSKRIFEKYETKKRKKICRRDSRAF